MIKELKSFLEKTYGVGGNIKKLSGYDDLNYLVYVNKEPLYILKISKGKDQKLFLEAQQNILRILNKLDMYAFPQVKTDLKGFHFPVYNKKDIARVLTYIPGKFLAEVSKSEEMYFAFGQFLGRMDQLLFKHEDPVIQSRHIQWDIQYFPEFRQNLKYIPDFNLKKLIHYFILQFNECVVPHLTDIRKSIIHNDANDWNVLVKGKTIKGIIDFGDMVYTHTVNEIAIACTYMAMDSTDPIYEIVPLIRGYHDILPLSEQEVAILYYLIAARLGISLSMSAASKQKDPENAYLSIHEEKAYELLERWISINPEKAENIFREACQIPQKNTHQISSYEVMRRSHFSKALSLSYKDPIMMEKAAFQYMYGDQGKTFIDCVNNIMHVGHAHPVVVEAGVKQMTRLNTNTRYYYKSLYTYTEELLNHFPTQLNKIFYVNSGSAASDLAIRLARNYTRRKDIVVMEHGYHGNTTTTIEISHYKFSGKGGKGPESFIHVAPIPDTYRGKYRSDDPEASIKYANAIDTYLEHQVAAFISEPIIGCGGQILLPTGYLKTVYDKIRHSGGICIADEVQTGFGRVGSHFWAYEMYDVVPDIVILGKPMGNGHPMGAVICTDEIASAFENGMEFFSSFGGNPVSCEIGSAVLDVIKSEKLQSHALKVGNNLLKKLNQLKNKYPIIGDVRGAGFFLGIELISDIDIRSPATIAAQKIINEMKDKGFLLSTDGPFNNVIKFKPPMCFSMDDTFLLIDAFENVLSSLTVSH